MSTEAIFEDNFKYTNFPNFGIIRQKLCLHLKFDRSFYFVGPWVITEHKLGRLLGQGDSLSNVKGLEKICTIFAKSGKHQQNLK